MRSRRFVLRTVACLFGVAAVSALAIIAHAETASPTGDFFPGLPFMPVWRRVEGYAEAVQTLNAMGRSPNPKVVQTLFGDAEMACLTNFPVRVTVLDSRMGMRNVRLLDGDRAGCRGWLPREWVR